MMVFSIESSFNFYGQKRFSYLKPIFPLHVSVTTQTSQDHLSNWLDLLIFSLFFCFQVSILTAGRTYLFYTVHIYLIFFPFKLHSQIWPGFTFDILLCFEKQFILILNNFSNSNFNQLKDPKVLRDEFSLLVIHGYTTYYSYANN